MKQNTAEENLAPASTNKKGEGLGRKTPTWKKVTQLPLPPPPSPQSIQTTTITITKVIPPGDVYEQQQKLFTLLCENTG